MNGDGVDLELTRSSDHPRVGSAVFIGTPETFRGAGENDSGHRWMLQDRARASRLRRNTLHLAPAITSVLTLVDTTASRGNDVVRVARIDVDGEDVGVVDDAVLDGRPRLSTVHRFIRQIECAGVNRVGCAWIYRERLDVNQSLSALSRKLFPCFARIVGAKDARESAGDQRVRI